MQVVFSAGYHHLSSLHFVLQTDILFLIYLYTSYLRLLKIQENKKEAILNSQENIIVITLGNEIIDANQRLYDFFTNTKDLESFKKTYKCKCFYIDYNILKNFILIKK